jgi:hypothetical protein
VTGVLLLIPMLVWVGVAAFSCYCVYRYQLGIGRIVTTESTARVAIIIPMRGVPDTLDALWRGLRAQLYGSWRLIFVVESKADPAFAALSRLAADGGEGLPVEILIAGRATDTGQKVHNQLAALKTLRPDDRIIAFADADIVPPADWLTRIVRGLSDDSVAAVSGYRWLMPKRNNIATLLICAGNASIATLPRPRNLNHAWGGTMAVRREILDGVDIERVWRGSVLDDLPLSTALRARGGTILGPRELLLPTQVDYSWGDGIAFARRQYLFVRLYTPKLWGFAAAATTLPLIGWAVALPLALNGDPAAIVVIVAANIFDQARATLRRRVVRALWGDAGLAAMKPVLRLDRFATPLWLAFHAAIIWSTLFGRTISWAGRVYRIDGRQSLCILREPPEP